MRARVVEILRCAAELCVTGFRSYGSTAIQTVSDDEPERWVAMRAYDYVLPRYISDGTLTEISHLVLLEAALLVEEGSL